MEQLLPMLINLVSGAAGGNIFGALLKNLSLGTMGNSIVGILGGGLGGQLLGMLGMASGDGGAAMDIGSIINSIASGGVGGGVLMVIIGVVKNTLTAKP